MHCVLFTLLPVLFYYIIKNLKGARQGLGGQKPLCPPPQKRLCGTVITDHATVKELLTYLDSMGGGGVKFMQGA